MLRSIIISSIAAFLFALSMRLFAYGRERETDSNGRPVLRYLAAPYMMAFCASAFLAVAIYQWLDPFNHRYTGNLVLLSYIPGAVGILTLGCAFYYLTYRATLTRNAIEVYRWPIGHKTYRLADLRKIDEVDRNVVVQFAGNQYFKIYHTYSGRAHFIRELSANNSFKPTPLRGIG